MSASREELNGTLDRSYAALKVFFAPSRQQETACNPAQLVVFAEQTKHGRCEIALECIQLYFSLDPPANQFLIRAHLCEAAATVASCPGDEVVFLQALGSIVKAVNIAKKSECYHFLVYNASVLLWQTCRPYHKPGSRKLFTKPLQSVVRALDDCKEQDFSWRLELLIGLIYSQVDAGLKDAAVKTCASAAVTAKKRVPSRLPDVLKMQAYFDLGDGKQFEKEMKTQTEYAVIQRLYKIKCAIHQHGLCGTELEERLRKVFNLITKSRDEVSGRKTSQSTTIQPPPIETRPPLLIELGEVCLAHGLTQLAEECMAVLPADLQDSRLHLLRECLHAGVMVQTLDSQGESYNRNTVQARLQSIAKIEETLTQATRLGEPELIQWNLSLPLLQPNLRQQLLRPLTAVGNALEDISSLLQELRTTVHFELAKICADQNQLNIAIKHLEKASGLDLQGSYTEQLGALQHRLTLRAQLYETPDNPVDLAAKIIEQASSSAGSDDLRSVLVKAGDVLAPDCFIHTLGKPLQESATLKVAGGMSSHDVEILLQEKASKLGSFELARQQAEDHAQKLGAKNDRERCRLWADLAKTARKQSVWDVASSSAIFCLLHDDQSSKVNIGKESKLEQKQSNRLSSPRVSKRGSSPKLESRRSTSPFYTAVSELGIGAASSLSVASKQQDDKDFTRILAEIHCLYAECLVYQLQQEGLQLGMKPQLSMFGIKTLAEDAIEQHWLAYTKWADAMTQAACKSFLRAAELGCILGESWLVCNAAAYLFNYHHHWVQQNTLTETIEAFRPLLTLIKQAKLQNEELLVVRVCSTLAGGLVQKWMPKPVDPASTRASAATATNRKAGKQDKKGKGQGGGAAGDQLHVDPESGPELKEALEVCEYAMGISSTIPLSIRSGVLAVWIQCKQLAQQPIPSKTFGIEERNGDRHTHHCRAVVAIEMISRLGNKIWDFPNCPTLQEVFVLLNECEWSEQLDTTEVGIWTRVAGLALKQRDYTLVCQCAGKAIELKKKSLPEETDVSQKDPDIHRVLHELLSLACSLEGQALAATAVGNIATTRQSLEAFLSSARFAEEAVSLSLAMEACAHYWNTCQPLVGNTLERSLLREPLSELLELVAALGEKKRRQNKSQKEDAHLAMGGRELTLLAAMYGVVFQAFADKHEWEEGLQAIEDAMWHTPRPLHRHLAQHKLVFKSQMGKNIEGDMIRFQEEPEDFVASLWHKAAVNSTEPCDQLKAYQNAIQTLQSAEYDWRKVEYLLEFSEWLYQHHFPVEDAIDQLLRVVETLLNLREDKQGLQDDGVQTSTPVCSSEALPLNVTSVKQLEALLRVHVMMLQLIGRGTPDHKQFCIAAVGYCSKMLQQAISSNTEEAGRQACQLPTTTEEWGAFTLPEQLLEVIKSDCSVHSLNRTTITKPMLLLHYLGVLERELAALSLHCLVFPVLTLQLAVAEGLVPDSRPLCQLLHMRLAKLCLDLNLQSAAAVHNDKVGSQILYPEDLARSQVDMQHFQAKQLAVEKEESKRSTSSSRPSVRIKSSRRHLEKKQSSSSPKQSPIQPCSVCEEVVLREVWVQQAFLLLQQRQYQVTRELLQQSLLSSQVFADSHTELQSQLSLATLALAEKHTQKAIQILTKIQSLPADLDVWLRSVLLLVDAVWSDGDYREQCVAVLEHALGLAKAVGGSSRNEAQRVEYAESRLKARLALCKIDGMSPCSKATVSPSFAENCQMLSDCVASLLSLGYPTEAAELLSQHASILRDAGNCSVESERRHKYLLEALDLHQQSAGILQFVYDSAKEYCQSKSEEVVLPVQRELVQALLCVAELLVDVFSEHANSLRPDRDKQQQQSSVEKMIDEYVRESPELSPVGRAWHHTVESAVDRAMSTLSSAHTLAKNYIPLKIKCIYTMGRCLHSLSKYSSPDPALQWGKDNLAAEGKGSGGSLELGGRNNYSTLSTVMRKKEADGAEIKETHSLNCVAQACHLLAEAVALALKNKQWDLAMQASLEIVECCGCFDAATSSLYLSLYQSLAVSAELHVLMREVLADPSNSELGTLLEQNTKLTMSCNPSPALEANTQKLNSYMVCQRLQVSKSHLEHLKSFPSNFRFIVLHHSPDRSRLYAAYLIPPQPPPPAPKKGQPPSEIFESLEPVVSYCAISPSTLGSLLELATDYKVNRKQTLLKSQQFKTVGTDADLEMENESQFADVVAAMESYLYPVLRPIATALKRESREKGLSVVLLADSSLLQLPLEALGVLHAENITSVTRDLSLQLLHHRISKFLTQDESGDKKRDKFQPQPDTLLANTTNFKYLLDPRKDLASSEEKDHPASAVLSEIHAHAKLTAKWTGHDGTENIMSVNEWPSMIKASSGLLLFLSERLLAHFPPAKLLPLSLHDCSLVLLLDHMQTTHSAKLQSKLDFHRSAFDLKFEQSLVAVSILSLTGVGCITANQWYTTAETNTSKTIALMRALLSESNSVGAVNWTSIKETFAPTQGENGDAMDEHTDQGNAPQSKKTKPSIAYNCVVYGLPHLTLLAAS